MVPKIIDGALNRYSTYKRLYRTSKHYQKLTITKFKEPELWALLEILMPYQQLFLSKTNTNLTTLVLLTADDVYYYTNIANQQEKQVAERRATPR